LKGRRPAAGVAGMLVGRSIGINSPVLM
jgi:hypothetical protein